MDERKRIIRPLNTPRPDEITEFGVAPTEVEDITELLPDERYELCANCGFAKWRHETPKPIPCNLSGGFKAKKEA